MKREDFNFIIKTIKRMVERGEYYEAYIEIVNELVGAIVYNELVDRETLDSWIGQIEGWKTARDLHYRLKDIDDFNEDLYYIYADGEVRNVDSFDFEDIISRIEDEIELED